MSGEKRSSKKTSVQSKSIRDNPPPPPPPRPKKQSSSSSGIGREKSKRENGGSGRSVGTKSIADTKVSKSTVRSSRTRESNRTNRSTRSKSRTRDAQSSRSRSKSRPRETPREGRSQSGRSTGSRSKSKTRGDRSRSRSRARPQDGSRSSPKKQQSKKSSNSKNNSSTKSKSQKNGTRSSPTKQPSSRKREKFASNAQQAIPASVRMISGSHDSQTSADVSNINSQFQLPNNAGRSGGACTAALLQVLYQSHEYGHDDISWVDVLRQMRDVLNEKGFEQIPQLTSSRMIDVHDRFAITPADGSFSQRNNTKRAVLIGINYTGQKGELSGCHNDVNNVARYLSEVQGFKKENVTILMDDGNHKPPTKSAIISAYKKLVKESKKGDVVFCHYSGHGGRLPDDNGDEEDGYDETLIPVDFEKRGQIRDDDLLKILVGPMPEGVTMTCLMDCCHSGTVLDLPYRFTSDGDLEEMEMNERCNFKDGLWSGMGLALGMAAGSAVVDVLTPQPEMMILGGGPNAIHEYSDSDCCVIS